MIRRIQCALLDLGVPFFAIGIVFFGFEYLRYGRYEGGLPAVPPWAPAPRVGPYLVGALLITVGLGIAFDAGRRSSAIVLAAFILACVVFLHGSRIAAVLADGRLRTRALEPLAVAAAAMTLLGIAPLRAEGPAGRGAGDRAARLGRCLFAFCMVVFGVQHFLFRRFVSNLVTPWIPAHAFWVVFTGLCLIAAGLAIATGHLGRAAATWLGTMFLLWFLLEHAPRVAASPGFGPGWDSMFVALAMSGGSFIVARTMPGRGRTPAGTRLRRETKRTDRRVARP